MIYIASPYSSTHRNARLIMERRFRAACAACEFYRRKGENVYSPIVHWHTVAELFAGPRDHSGYSHCHEEMIFLSREFRILMLDGWEDSEGIKWELARARYWSRPVTYINPESIILV